MINEPMHINATQIVKQSIQPRFYTTGREY